MWKAALAGAIALATVGSLSVSSQGVGVARAAAQDVILTDAHIAPLKSTLKLTPAQEQHWHPVEATLRALVHQKTRDDSAEAGLVRRVHARVAGYTVNAVALQRLASVAQPLLNSLDEGQKRDGLTVIRAMGVANLF